MARGTYCPLVNGKCKEEKCAFYTTVRGVNPQTGAEIDNTGCAIQFMPLLLIENSQQQRQTGAAVESMRNETVKSSETTQQILIAAAQGVIQPATVQLLESNESHSST